MLKKAKKNANALKNDKNAEKCWKMLKKLRNL